MAIFSNRWVQAGLAAALIIGIINFFEHAVTVVEPTPEELASRAAAKTCVNGSTAARLEAQSVVKSVLKSPRSASFSDERTAHLGDCRMEVSGHVYAQNSFGAEIRSIFIVTMIYEPESDRWLTVDVVVE